MASLAAEVKSNFWLLLSAACFGQSRRIGFKCSCSSSRAVSVQNRRDSRFRLAVGSFIESYNNYMEIITRRLPVPCYSTHHIQVPESIDVRRLQCSPRIQCNTLWQSTYGVLTCLDALWRQHCTGQPQERQASVSSACKHPWSSLALSQRRCRKLAHADHLAVQSRQYRLQQGG